VPSYAHDIRPMFRDQDIEEMRFAFDLSQYDDVSAQAESIYARLADGSMPCDGAWTEDRLALFRQWMEEGCSP
jgi:phage gp29-like protein